MTDEESFLAAIAANPADRTTRGVYADWLRDRGEYRRAAIVSLIADAVRDIDLPAILDSHDWQEVFGEGDGGNTDKRTDVCPPGATDVDNTAPMLVDVVEVIAAVNGESDESEWVGVFRLRDGRYLLANGGCDYTGWDCQASNHLEVANTLDDILAIGLTAEHRVRLNLPETINY